jgi:hypothetical protein
MSSIAHLQRISTNELTTLPVMVALLVTLVDQTHAQAQKSLEAETIGSCVAIQTNVTTTETPFGLQATGSCEINSDGATASCTVEIVATGPDIILDVQEGCSEPRHTGVITARILSDGELQRWRHMAT